MSVCPTVSVLRFYGCCHPCLIKKLGYTKCTKCILRRCNRKRKLYLAIPQLTCQGNRLHMQRKIYHNRLITLDG